MIKNIWNIAKLDLIIWSRMHSAIASALIPPLGMLMILVALSLAVLQQPIALVVEGNGVYSRKMQSIIQSDTDAYLNYDFSSDIKPIDSQTAWKWLYNQQVAAIITVPVNFDQQVREGSAKVHLTLNNVDIDFADDIRRSVDRSVAHFDAPILSPNDAEENGVEFDPEAPNPYLISIDEEDLRETNVEWLHYQVIPVLVLLVLNVGLMGTALLCAQDSERKTARYLALSPYRSWELVAGRLSAGVIASLSTLIPGALLCMLFTNISPPAGHWPALLAVFVATAVCAAGLGAVIGTAFRGSRTIVMLSSVVSTYMFFLGGGFSTIAFLPEWIQTISAFIPMRYAIDGMRQALFYSNLNGVPFDLAVLTLTAVVATGIGSVMVRRSWSE